jgi:hypothetical protein
MLLAKIAVAPRSVRKRRLKRTEIAERLLDVELATVGALRALQMDLGEDRGVPVETALRQGRRALRK